MQAEVFLDTAHAIALSSPNDQFHARDIELAGHFRAVWNEGKRTMTPSLTTQLRAFVLPAPLPYP